MKEKIENSKFANSILIGQALEQAKMTHQNQKRDDRESYLEEHIYPVVADLIDHFADENGADNLLAAAALHDVLEDDKIINDEKFIAEFGQKIYDIVKPITKNQKQNLSDLSQEEKKKINKKMLTSLANAPYFSKVIKLADRANNLAAIYKIEETDKPKFERYVTETKENFLPFARRENEYYYQKLKSLLEELKNENIFN